jgi:hypothetical protein
MDYPYEGHMLRTKGGTVEVYRQGGAVLLHKSCSAGQAMAWVRLHNGIAAKHPAPVMRSLVIVGAEEDRLLRGLLSETIRVTGNDALATFCAGLLKQLDDVPFCETASG